MSTTNYPAISRATIAQIYGFRTHKAFAQFLEKHYPKCIQELQSQGWDAKINDDYMPAWTELLLKHLGKPQYKAVTVKELAEAYGIKAGTNINKMIARVPDMNEELTKTGWHPTVTRLLPMWLEIIFMFLGEPKGIRHLKQPLDFRTAAVVNTRKIKRR